MISVVIECLLMLDLVRKMIFWLKNWLSFCIYFREIWYLLGQNVDEITKTPWSHVNAILKLNHIDYRYPVWILNYYDFHQLVELKYRHVNLQSLHSRMPQNKHNLWNHSIQRNFWCDLFKVEQNLPPCSNRVKASENLGADTGRPWNYVPEMN